MNLNQYLRQARKYIAAGNYDEETKRAVEHFVANPSRRTRRQRERDARKAK